MIIRSVMKRTCMAMAFRFGRPGAVRLVESVAPPAQCTKQSLGRSCSTRLLSTFTPPEPPSSKGMAVYADINFEVGKMPDSEAGKRNKDSNAVFVVSGASRGIGLQFVKDLVDRTEGTVVACCRSPESASGLNAFLQSLDSSGVGDRVRVVPLDLEDQSSIETAASSIQDMFDRVDVLVNVAGLLGDGRSTPGPERSLSKLDRSWVEKTMAVNVIGPVMLSKELAPLMKSKRRGKGSDEVRPVSVIASLSARVGSISDNELGGWYSYRFSKTALNQATRTMAHELKRQGTMTCALHPGTTDSDLSKPFQKNVQEGRLFPVKFTVKQLLDVIDSLTDEHSGGFYDWAGKALPF